MEDARRFEGLARCRVGRLEVPIAAGGIRLVGLARLDQSRAGSGLIIPRCSSVHTFGMRFPLHMIFLDEDRVPVRIALDVRPRRVLSAPGSEAVVEVVPAGPDGLDGIRQVLHGASRAPRSPGEEGCPEAPDGLDGPVTWQRAG